MSNETPRTPAELDLKYTRRAGLTEEILHLAANPHVRSFALARALDGLSLPELEALLQELDETFYGSRPNLSTLFQTKSDPKSDSL
jgi:hypothetical protein